jgi:hypothetical protein
MGNRISSRDDALASAFEREAEWRSPLPPTLWQRITTPNLDRVCFASNNQTVRQFPNL